MKRIFYWLCYVAVCLGVVGCTKGFNEDEESLRLYRGIKEPALYKQAIEAVRASDYSSAIQRLEALNVMHPFSPHAKQAQLYLISSYFENNDFAQAAASAERFIHLYPRDKNVDYAYYMRGTANFEQQRGTFARLFNIDPAWRDAGSQWQSFNDFKQLVERFPKSRYRDDSLQRMVYLRNQFAQHELHLANFYFQRKQYVAALSRATNVIRIYNHSPQAKTALVLSKKINERLHLSQAVRDIQQVEKHTY